MGNLLKGAAGLLGAAAVAEAAGIAYFYRRTMKRYNAKTERTMKMSGVDWEKYFPIMHKRSAWMMELPHQDVWIKSRDGLKLHGTYFKGDEGTKAVICFHGYTSKGLNDYGSLSYYYLKHGFRMLLIDERAHGDSEGTYIGFGTMDRYDGMEWIKWMIQEIGEDAQILLHGNSMGGATVCMMGGMELPPQVKGIVSDCAFTSAKDVFTHVLHSMYHLPAFPMIQIADRLNRKNAGYGLDDCNAAREVRKARVPFLFIHGEDDVFVPCWMCHELYKNCASPKTKLIVKGAGHGESYYKDTQAYENALDSFIGGIMK